jgi:hypothetical protein
MTDGELGSAWTELNPTELELRRMNTRVFAWLEANDTSLLGEWVGLFAVNPVAAVGLVTASPVAMLATPVVWLVAGLL